MRRMWAVFSGFSWKTMPSHAPLRPRASRYTSMKPLIVSTARGRIGHPRDVVRATVLLLPGPIEADERLERRARGRWRDGTRGLEVRDHARQRRAVAAADAVHVLAQTSRRRSFDRRELSAKALLEAVEVGRRDVRVQVVGACREDVLARRRRLARDHRPPRLVQEVARMGVDECRRRGMGAQGHVLATRAHRCDAPPATARATARARTCAT